MRWLKVSGWIVPLSLLLFLFAGPASVSAEKPNFYYTTVTKTATTTTAVTDSTLWDPAANNRFVLQGVLISATNAVQVELEVSDVDVVPPVYVTSTGVVLVGGGENPIYLGAKDAVLTWSTTQVGVSPNHGKVSIMAWGYEEEL